MFLRMVPGFQKRNVDILVGSWWHLWLPLITIKCRIKLSEEIDWIIWTGRYRRTPSPVDMNARRTAERRKVRLVDRSIFTAVRGTVKVSIISYGRAENCSAILEFIHGTIPDYRRVKFGLQRIGPADDTEEARWIIG